MTCRRIRLRSISLTWKICLEQLRHTRSWASYGLDLIIFYFILRLTVRLLAKLVTLSAVLRSETLFNSQSRCCGQSLTLHILMTLATFASLKQVYPTGKQTDDVRFCRRVGLHSFDATLSELKI